MSKESRASAEISLMIEALGPSFEDPENLWRTGYRAGLIDARHVAQEVEDETFSTPSYKLRKQLKELRERLHSLKERNAPTKDLDERMIYYRQGFVNALALALLYLPDEGSNDF